MKGRKREESKPEVVNRFFLKVPCHFYNVEFQICQPEEFHEFHFLVMELVQKESDLRSVLKHPILNDHVMQEILTDLVYKGLAFIDLKNGKIKLSPEVEDHIKNGTLREGFLYLKPPRTERVELVQDLSTGHVLNADNVYNYRFFPSGKNLQLLDLAKLPKSSFPPLSSLSIGTLGKAAFSKLQKRDSNIEEDHIERVLDIREVCLNETLFIPVETKEYENESIVHTPLANIPPHLLNKWKVLINEPTALFKFDETRVSADITTATPHYTIEPLRVTLLSLMRELKENGRKSELKYLQHRIQEQFETLQEHLGELLTSVGKVESFVGTGDGHLDLVCTLVEEAHSFVVIQSAFMTAAALDDLVPILKKKVKEGVHIILAWGMMGEGLQEDADRYAHLRSMENKLRESIRSEHLSLCKTKRVSHAKYVYADCSKLALGSFNFLSGYHQNTQTNATAVLSEGTVPRTFANFVIDNVDLNEHARKAIEDTISMISKKQDDLLSSRQQRLNELEERFESLVTVLGEHLSSSTAFSADMLKSAVSSSSSYLQQLKKISTAHLVFDTDHRDSLISSFELADRELYISSDKLNELAVGAVFNRALERALRQKKHVSILWGKEMGKGKPTKELKKSIQIAEALNQKSSDLFAINVTPAGNHAKAVVVDKRRSIVTSFNFLSVGGMDSRFYLLPQELGVIISDENVAQKLKNELPWP